MAFVQPLLAAVFSQSPHDGSLFGAESQGIKVRGSEGIHLKRLKRVFHDRFYPLLSLTTLCVSLFWPTKYGRATEQTALRIEISGFHYDEAARISGMPTPENVVRFPHPSGPEGIRIYAAR